MTPRTPVYMDYHATTPVDPRVRDALLPFLTDNFGNAASRNHAFGWRAEEAAAEARHQAAELIGARPREIVFTSGATESNNLAIKGVAEKNRDRGRRLITCATEHKAVLDPCAYLAGQGFEVTVLPVDSGGLLDPEAVERAITPRTILVSVMYANNEIGVIQPIRRIGGICRERGVYFHVDAAQAAGKIPVDVEADCIDLLSFTAHKIYGPKGIGALYVRRRGPRVGIAPQIHGGGHERGLRSGTLNVPGIVGFGKACELCMAEREEEARRTAALRDRLWEGLRDRIQGVFLNGAQEPRLPNNLNVSFESVDGESLLMGLDDIAVSSGSACTTDRPEPSHVLQAIGVPGRLANASLRFGLGRFSTVEEVDYAIEKVVRVVERLREHSPAGQSA